MWNLSLETRNKILSPPPSLDEIKRFAAGEGVPPRAIPTQLEVGYGTDLHMIYYGQLRNGTQQRDGADIITKLSSGDGEDAFTRGRILVTIPASASPAQILTTVGNLWVSGGVGQGNLDSAASLATATFGGVARTLHGSLTRITTDVCTMNGMNWSIQNNALQILKVGALLKPAAQAVKLSASSGLVGVPSVDTKGILKCQALIQPNLWPGLPLVIDAEFIKGTYRIEEVEFSGDTSAQDWYANITGRAW